MPDHATGRLTLRRSCPSCAAAHGELLFEQRFARIEGISIHGGYDVVACATCGTCFADGIPDQPTFDAYYQLASKYEGSGKSARLPAATMQRFAQEVVDIEHYLPSYAARLLEVGSATGALLGILKERGYRNVYGLDPSPTCARVAREQHGVEVRTGDLSDASLAPDGLAPYDAILMIAVLEHVVDVASALRKVRAALTEDGLLFIEVPDAARFVSSVDAPYQELSVEHINYFSGQSLGALAGRHGFALVDVLERDRAHTEGCTAPVVAAVFRKRRADEPATGHEVDTVSAAAMRTYLAASRERENVLRTFVAELADRHEPLIVWGTGTLTLRLLETSDLARLPIAAFVDGNERYWGKTIRGIPVLSPDQVRGRPEAILVSSTGQRLAIARDIRERLSPAPRVLTYPQC